MDQRNANIFVSIRVNGMADQNTLVNTQNVSVTKIVYSSSIQSAESKYGLKIQFLALSCHDT
jgi:hypothetical protein